MRRYGIAEWYGRPFVDLAPTERQELAAVALGESAAPDCPFRAGACSKKGGVCSLRMYENEGDRAAAPVGDLVIVCPDRFEQGQTVVHWLADIVGFDEASTLIAREIPFMLGTGTNKPAGKIDMVVAEQQHTLVWYGLEIQAVYFSGPGMEREFALLREDQSLRPPFPLALRRPDWRSSSAKRLMPQLQVKGPTLRRWHSKIAVAVDKPFFASIGGPSAAPSHDLDSGDVIWLVPELSSKHQLARAHWEVLTLEATAAKLLAARDIRRDQFERFLRERLVPLPKPRSSR